MPRGRKPHVDPPTTFTINLPSSLAGKLELLLYDPISGKPKYGGRSQLVQELLRKWVDEQISQNQSPSALTPPISPSIIELAEESTGDTE